MLFLTFISFHSFHVLSCLLIGSLCKKEYHYYFRKSLNVTDVKFCGETHFSDLFCNMKRSGFIKDPVDAESSEIFRFGVLICNPMKTAQLVHHHY